MNEKHKLMKRFWLKTVKDPDTGCRNWTAALNSAGYGVIGIKKKVRYAHRIAWELLNGCVPAGLFVCHHCDNRKCVNPKHLFLGTNQENAQDMSRKGRAPFQKISLAQSKQIRQMYTNCNISQRKLARVFGVSKWLLQSILKGRSHSAN
jgi:DNA-binding transcriptional regulator YiaG